MCIEKINSEVFGVRQEAIEELKKELKKWREKANTQESIELFEELKKCLFYDCE